MTLQGIIWTHYHDEKTKTLSKIIINLYHRWATPFKWKVLSPYLKHADVKLIFIDGGLIHRDKFLLKAPLITKKSLSIGDGDSSNQRMNMLKTDQNLSDLSYCLNF